MFVKDESARFGLAAFKALGVSWAVHLLLPERGGGDRDRPRAHREPPGPYREPPAAGAPSWLVTATDGNHGRAVARTARRRGVRARVFAAEGVHPGAVAAIGAEDAARAARDLAAHGVSAGPCGAHGRRKGERAEAPRHEGRSTTDRRRTPKRPRGERAREGGGVGAAGRRAVLAAGPGTTVVLLGTEGTAADRHGATRSALPTPTPGRG
ncbi:pyridoxal-phosphate dependent enzyme [Streptomyces wuyuanensis]|uniref:Pyridoxal-phosphate dependent enzyme n=1 Tax=Streptomyces wuyuanensis TaxID=1196353 RepID=A0A1G9PXJ2_9ACTN|nr:pyridoxal-phosphate dependent enzyme [Streptomyces wuyuanensis]SDM03464.1 Pyridoxal-phosphate dependent enzyme [Streptomyces wuyuanensis]